MCWCMCIQPCTQAYLVLKQFHRIPLADLEMVLPGEGMKPSYRGGLAHFAVHCPRSALHATCIECPLATLLKCVCLHARAVVQQSMLAPPPMQACASTCRPTSTSPWPSRCWLAWWRRWPLCGRWAARHVLLGRQLDVKSRWVRHCTRLG